MIDVFVCTISDAYGIRSLLREACHLRWNCDEQANLHTLAPWHPDVDCLAEQFQRERRIKADELATSDIYIVADDDCMPIGPNFIERGLKVMEAHPEHGILAALNVRSDTLFKNHVPPYCGQFIDDDVWECHAVGGIRFCRKGIIKKWPESVSSGSYDCQHHEGLVNAGYKAGYFRNITFNHLGEGLSQHWPEVPEIELYKEKVCS